MIKRLLGTLLCMIIPVMLFAGKGAYDPQTGAQGVEPVEHINISLGSYVAVSSMTIDLADNGSSYFLIDLEQDVTIKEINVAIIASSGGDATLRILKGNTVDSSGTAILANSFNQSRATSTIQATVYDAPDARSGTVIYETVVPDGRTVIKKMILPKDDNYLVIIKNDSGAAATTGYEVQWYETD